MVALIGHTVTFIYLALMSRESSIDNINTYQKNNNTDISREKTKYRQNDRSPQTVIVKSNIQWHHMERPKELTRNEDSRRENIILGRSTLCTSPYPAYPFVSTRSLALPIDYMYAT